MKTFAFLALLGCACTVPSLGELERQRPRACDESHACTEGYLCVGGLCRLTGVGACVEAETRACGKSQGECVQGTETCGSNNQWSDCVGAVGPVAEVCDGKDNNCDDKVDEGATGAGCGVEVGVCANAKKRCVDGGIETTCTAATFGPDYEALERSCDNKDNDCDGMTDESITRACEKDAGVCAGLQVACIAGAFGSCDDLYRSRPGYQAFEQLCDGLDNDCDSNTDKWSPQNASSSANVSSRHASATQLFSGPVMVLWEEGSKVAARVANPDGTFSAVATPSESINVASRAFLPVVASSENVVYAAWAEELPSKLRVMLAPLDDTGKSTITAGAPPAPSAMAIEQVGTSLSALALAVDSAANRVYLASVVDGRLNFYAFPLALPATPVYEKLNQLSGTIGKVALATAGGGSMWLAAEQRTPGTIRRCSVDPTGSLSCVTPDRNGTGPQLTPRSTAPSAVALTFANAANALVETCVLGVDAGCSGLSTLFSGRAAISNLSVGFNANGAPHALGWVESGRVNAGVLFPDGGVVSTSLSGVDAQPRALSLAASISMVVTDLDNANGALSSEIVLQRQCGP